MSTVREAVARRIREVLDAMPPTTDEQRARAVAILATTKPRAVARVERKQAA